MSDKLNYHELFKDKWKWQAVNPLEPSENWPKLATLGVTLRYFSNSIPCYVSALRRPEGSRICTCCPVKWGTEDSCVDTFCTDFNSPLAEWYRLRYVRVGSQTSSQLAAVAWAISELPWLE